MGGVMHIPPPPWLWCALLLCPHLFFFVFHVYVRVRGLRQLTDRTRADVQGGILTEYEGKPKLVEAVQVPPEHLHEFHLLKKFNLFNTNNLWVSLRAVQVRAIAVPAPVHPALYPCSLSLCFLCFLCCFAAPHVIREGAVSRTLCLCDSASSRPTPSDQL